MSVILQPQVTFPLVRQIANHLDATVYYVRAVVRDVHGDIIDTINLASQGDQRYQTAWRVPADTSGQGAYVSIITSVYTDSGYTSKSPDYGDEENTYLIADRVSRGGGGGMMVGASGGVDSRTVRRIFQEELAKLPPPERVEFPKMPEIPEMRWNEVLKAIKDLKVALKPEKPEKVDFKPLFDALESLRSDVKEKEVTPPTDLSPLMAKLDEKEETDDLTREELVSILGNLGEELTTVLPKKVEKILRGASFKIEATDAKMELPKEKKAEPVIFDLSKLTS